MDVNYKPYGENFERPLSELTMDDVTLLIDLLYGYHTENVANYLIKVLHDNSAETWTDTEGIERAAYRHLFHANSVKTAVDYIRGRELYSREFGVRRGIQTPQRSDELDRELKIFNDIFFDNMDIPYVCNTNTSAYGPIMFVFDPEIIRDRIVRVTKVNPVKFGADHNESRFIDLYFCDIDEIRDAIKETIRETGSSVGFVNDTMHHTTIFNTEELPFGDHLKAIYIEKYDETSGRENEVADLIRSELDAVGLNSVEIAIRPNKPVNFSGYATDREVLWEMP